MGIYGLNHPTWKAPDCWYYDSAEEAHRARVKVYGPHSGHEVIRRVPLSGPMGVRWVAHRVIPAPTPEADT